MAEQARRALAALHQLGLVEPIRFCKYRLSTAGHTWLAAQSVSPVAPKRRRFLVRLLVEIDLDERLLADVLTDEWRQQHYATVRTAEDVADHLAFNLVQGRSLATLDGFADQPEDRARLLGLEIEDPAVEVSVEKPRTRQPTVKP
jgi:hypothetical protein